MIYVFLADGFELIEAMTPVDVMRRCDLQVVTVGIGSKRIKSAQNVYVETDITEAEFKLSENIQMIVLPGGMPGTRNLENNPVVKRAIEYCTAKNIYIAAICAAPSILGKMNLLTGKNAVCFPSYEKELFGAKISNDYVCKDGFYITAKGAGVSLEFALKIAEVLCGKPVAEKIRASMQSR